MATNYEAFIAQLDAFIDRYYGYEIRKGILRSAAALLLLFLLMAAAESLFFFGGGTEAGSASGSSSALRTLLFWLYVAAGAGVVAWQVGLPLWKRFGGARETWPAGWRRMSRKEAARLLSAHFPDLDDRLYNVLELKEISDNTPILAAAAIEQISAGFHAYRFTSVFKPAQLRPLWFVLGVPLLLTVAAAFFFPAVLGGSSKRLMHPRQTFERTFPFNIRLQDSVLTVPYGDRYILDAVAEGEWLPSALTVWVETAEGASADEPGAGFRADCRTVAAGRYTYAFGPLYQDVVFHLTAGRYVSRPYRLRVVPPVVLTSLTLDLTYPAYTSLAPRRIDAVSELAETGLPYGTRMCWRMALTGAEGLDVVTEAIGGETSETAAARREPDAAAVSDSAWVFLYEAVAQGSAVYKFVPRASAYRRADTVICRTEVWPDRYPRIEAEGTLPPAEAAGLYESILQGEISDDYGFYSLLFRVKDEDGKPIYTDTLFHGGAWASRGNAASSSGHAKLFFSENGRWARFVYGVTPDVWTLPPGVSVFYELEVRDNDPYGGYKAAVSRTFAYRVAAADEAQQQWRERHEQVAQALDSVSAGQAAFAEQFRDVSRSLLENTGWDWSDRQKVERMIAEQKAQMEAYRETVQALEQQRRADKTEYSDGLREQERQLEELMSQLWNEEALQKLQQIEEWLQENAPKEKVVEALTQWQEEHRDLVRNWERNKEIYKRLEFEKGLQKMASDLQALAEAQQDLRTQTEQMSEEGRNASDSAAAALAEEQAALNRRYDEMRRTLESLDRQNGALKRPFPFELPSDLMEDVSSQMQRAGDALQRNQPKAAANPQQKASEGLQALGRNMAEQQAAMQADQDAEDAEYLRLLLKEIVRLSFEQEDLMGQLQQMVVSDPRYGAVIRRQSRLNRDMVQVEDSIRALSVRQPQIAVHTQGVLKHLRWDSQKALADLLTMNTTVYRYYRTQNRQAEAAQQRAMNGLNELALLLSESLDQMQMNLSMQGSGGKGKPQAGAGMSESGDEPQDSPEPGEDGGQPKPGEGPSLREMQESLNRGLEALQKAMQGQPVSSEAFMRAAAQQEMIRRALQKQMEEMKRQGGKAQGDLQRVLGDMERTERELVHKTVTPQMLLRQQQIATRLLEAENAELKREKEERRESKEGREMEPFRIEDWEFEEEDLLRSREGLQQRMPPLHQLLKQKVEKYFL